MSEKVFQLDFDPQKFVQGVESALTGLGRLESGTDDLTASMEELQKTVNTVSFNKPINDIKTLQSLLEQGKFKIDLTSINKSFDEFAKDTKELTKFLTQLKKQLNEKLKVSVDKAEFDDLINAIKMVDNGLAELGVTAENTNADFVPLKTQLKDIKIQLQQMEAAGLRDTAMFRKLEQQAGEVSDAISDQSASIRTLGSDTRKLDVAVEVVQGLTAVWQVYEGVLVAAGVSTEDAAKVTAKLNAVMAVANGVNQIANLLQKESAIGKVIDSIATKGLTASVQGLAASTFTAAGAMRALKIALISSGIGALVVGLGFVFEKFSSLGGSVDKAGDSLERFKGISEDNSKELQRIENANTSAIRAIENTYNERISLAKKNDAKESEIAILEYARDIEKVKKRREFLKQRISLLASEQQLLQKEANTTGKEIAKAPNEEKAQALINKQKEIRDLSGKILMQVRDDSDESDKLITDLNIKKNEIDKKIFDEGVEQSKKTKELYDEIKKQRIELKAEINNTNISLLELGVPTKEAIGKKYDQVIQNEIAGINDKYDKLTKAERNRLIEQRKNLNELIKKLNQQDLQIRQELALDNLNRLYRSKDLELAEQNAEFIQKRYDKERELIRINEEKKREEINNAYDDTILSLSERVRAGELTIAKYQEAIAVLGIARTNQLNLIKQNARKQDLENEKQYYEDLIVLRKNYGDESASVQETQIAYDKILAAKALQAGSISKKQYYEELRKIDEKYRKQKAEDDIKENSYIISTLETQFKLETDTVKRLEIKKQIAISQAKINAAKSVLEGTDVNEFGLSKEDMRNLERSGDVINDLVSKLFSVDKTDPRFRQFADEATAAINEVTDAYKEQAQAAVDAADAAVASQQKRVDEAQKIAEKGNAAYLKEETDQLRELESKREAAARRQIQIDAAVRTSQLLLALAQGISKGVATAQTAGGAALGIATIVASIVAALGQGAAISSSLSTPRLAEGTDSFGRNNMTGGADRLSRGRYRSGTDTIPAWLNEGEAVISTNTADKYQPTIKAIRRGLIPHDVMNQFVNNYRGGINYDRIGKAVQIKNSNATDMSETNNRLKRLEGFLSGIQSGIDGMKVNVAMDSDGFAASISTHLNRKNKIFNA